MIDPAQLAGAGMEQPEFSLMPAGRVGHRQAGGGDAAGGDVQHHPGADAVVPPAAGLVGVAAGGGPGGNTVLEGEAVEVAAVVGSQPLDEGRLPGGGKAAARREGGQAAEGRVHEHRRPGRIDHQLMGIDIAGGEAYRRHIEPITAFMALAGGEQVVELT